MSTDQYASVRKLAAEALFPFFKHTVLLKDRPDFDLATQIGTTVTFSRKGWKFKLDPLSTGHFEKWFQAGFDDQEWAEIEIEDVWQKYGYDYEGLAWYRKTFELPEKEAHLAAELFLKAIDESAWVWVNGNYVGQHDEGPNGWDQPFRLDVTKELKWGAKNQITIRVLSMQYGGGIWKPITIETLKKY